MSTRKLLLVDDDQIYGEVLAGALTRRGYEVSYCETVESARLAIEQCLPDRAVIDLRIGDASGLELVEQLSGNEATTQIVVLTGYGSIATAVQAMKLGATHYLTKPADANEIAAALEGESVESDEITRPPSVRRLEWEHIQKVLTENDGNISATARALGMHRRTLQRKLQKRPVRD